MENHNYITSTQHNYQPQYLYTYSKVNLCLESFLRLVSSAITLVTEFHINSTSLSVPL